MSIWKSLEKPILALAPMEDVTDTVFRQLIADIGAPDIFFTEFTSAEGICSEGYDEVAQRLKYTEKERPLIAQIWGTTPDAYRKSAEHLVELGFHGIDINMGCPVKKIVKQGACSTLIKNPPLASEIYQATVEGAGDFPVSIKTRIGYDKIQTEEWIGHLLELKPEVITIHGRTRAQMSKVPNNWEEIKKAVELKNQISPNTLIIGNGDITSLEEAHQVVNDYNVDGVMIGRGIFQNPWIFNSLIKEEDITTEMRLKLCIKHLKLFHETWVDKKNFNIMKKFLKVYVREFPGSAERRHELMQLESPEKIIAYVKKILQEREYEEA
jgi:nifR3 family TIM-barrel protein